MMSRETHSQLLLLRRDDVALFLLALNLSGREALVISLNITLLGLTATNFTIIEDPLLGDFISSFLFADLNFIEVHELL